MSRGAGGPAGATAGADRPAAGAGGGGEAGADNPRFRATLLRVLVVQAATLALLWFLQAVYHA